MNQTGGASGLVELRSGGKRQRVDIPSPLHRCSLHSGQGSEVMEWILLHILVARRGFSDEVICEQGLSGGEEANLTDIWETAFETEGTAPTKALRRGGCKCCFGKITRRYRQFEWRG